MSTVVNLSKGGVVNLSKQAPGLKAVTVGLGWTPASENNRVSEVKKGFFARLLGGGSSSETAHRSSGEYDLDAFIVLLQDGKYVKDSESIIYFGHKEHVSGSIIHHGDNLVGGGNGDDEQISVYLDKVPSKYDTLVIAVNIYRALEKNQAFGDITKAFIRLVDNKNNEEICRYDISRDSAYTKSTALVLGHLIRINNEWTFKAVGEGHTVRNLNEVADKYK